jgi:hypothetical protein
MVTDPMKKTLEDLWNMPAERLKDRLSSTLEEIQKFGIGRLLEEYPDFLTKLLKRLKEMGAAKLLNEVSHVSDRLTDLLWEGVTLRAGQSKSMTSVLQKAERDCHVNMEASDSPFKHHFIVEKGGIRGRSGLLHFKDEDFRFMGPTEVLIELLIGDLPLGLGNIELQTSGHPGWVSRVAPVIDEVGKLLRGA